MDNTAGILWALAAALMAAFTGVLAARPLRHMGSDVRNLAHQRFQHDRPGPLWLVGIRAGRDHARRSPLVRPFGRERLQLMGGSCITRRLTPSVPPRLMTIMSASPLLTLLLAVLFLGERPGPSVLGGTGLVVLGVILVSYEPGRGRWFQSGILWGFASALSLGVSVFIRKKGLTATPNIGLTVAWSNMVSIPIICGLRFLSPPRLFDWGTALGGWRPSSSWAC